MKDFIFQDKLLNHCINYGNELIQSASSDNFNIYRIGKPLGRGQYKECYEDTENPDHVILITDRLDVLKNEEECYWKMNRLGIRVPITYEGYLIFCYDGSLLCIRVVEKLYHIQKIEENIDLLTDILFVLQYIFDKKLIIVDLQLMSDTSGRPVFIDPIEMYKYENINMIDARAYSRRPNGEEEAFCVELRWCKNFQELDYIHKRKFLGEKHYSYS